MRFKPTERSTIAAIPMDRKWSAGPMPESMRRRGESKAPAQSTTSPASIRALAPPVAGEVSTPETVPPHAPELTPPFEILTRPAQIDHPVNAARAAEDLATRHAVDPTLCAGLCHRLITPVDVRAPEREVLTR